MFACLCTVEFITLFTLTRKKKESDCGRECRRASMRGVQRRNSTYTSKRKRAPSQRKNGKTQTHEATQRNHRSHSSGTSQCLYRHSKDAAVFWKVKVVPAKALLDHERPEAEQYPPHRREARTRRPYRNQFGEQARKRWDTQWEKHRGDAEALPLSLLHQWRHFARYPVHGPAQSHTCDNAHRHAHRHAYSDRGVDGQADV